MNEKIQALRVAPDKRHLQRADGSTFFYLADAAWELFHKLNQEEAEAYLSDRAEKGFTVIQASVLAERDGLRRSNAYGRTAFRIDDTGRFNPRLWDEDGAYSYWAHVDAVVKLAEEKGLYVALLPAWNDKFEDTRGEGPHMFNAENAYEYGLRLGARYKDAENIIWVMGGGCALTKRSQLNALDAMARGIRAGDEGRHLMTLHPAQGTHSSDMAHDEEWLDFNMISGGHSRARFDYQMIRRDYGRHPYKPVLDGESIGEGCPENFDLNGEFFDDADVRRSAYWAVLSGACGHAYVHHSVAAFVTLPDKDKAKGYYSRSWRDALNDAGSGQMKHLRSLVESVNFGEGIPAGGMVSGNMKGVNFVPVLKGEDWLFAYSAQGLPFDLSMSAEWDGAQARWFDPRSGEYAEPFAVRGGKIEAFVPPSAGRNCDWVLTIKKG